MCLKILAKNCVNQLKSAKNCVDQLTAMELIWLHRRSAQRTIGIALSQPPFKASFVENMLKMGQNNRWLAKSRLLNLNILCIVLSRPQIQSFRVIREHLRWTKSGELAKDVQSNKDAQMYWNFYIFNLKEPYDGTVARCGPYRSNSVLSSLKHSTLEFHWLEEGVVIVHFDWLAKEKNYLKRTKF